MLSKLQFSEVSQVFQQASSLGLIDDTDSSVLFYSFDRLDERLQHLKNLFPLNALHAIAIKSNPHPEVLRHIIGKGFGLEAASIEEVRLAAAQGIKSEKLVFDSPVKTRKEIKECLEKYPHLRLNVNSLDELDRIPPDNTFHLGVRINPKIKSDAPELFNVAGPGSKFGIPEACEQEIIDQCLRHETIDTIHIHIGSEFENYDLVTSTLARIRELADRINHTLATSINQKRISCIDIGGGFPASFDETEDEGIRQYVQSLEEKSPGIFNEYHIITEFGRFIHTNCGWAVSDIEYIRKHQENHNKTLLIHLGGDFFTRQVYSSDKKPYRLGVMSRKGQVKEKDTQQMQYDIAGPLCYAGDFPFRDIRLPAVDESDKLIIADTGANTYSLWSRHCSRDIPKVIGYSLSSGSFNILSKRKAVGF